MASVVAVEVVDRAGKTGNEGMEKLDDSGISLSLCDASRDLMCLIGPERVVEICAKVAEMHGYSLGMV